jgi:predicted DNA-binding transcriptional regulator AlpA
MKTKFPALSGNDIQKPSTTVPVLLVPKEAAQRLKLSVSWLAKARMRGDGPPYIKLGRSIRYPESGLLQWMKSRTRTSTSEG